MDTNIQFNRLDGDMDEGYFVSKISGVPTKIEYTISNTFIVKCSFNSHGKDYIFHMSKWSGTGLSYFTQLFISQYNSESQLFGQLLTTPVGIVPDPNNTNKQRLNMIKYAMRDVFNCAEVIIQKNGRSVLDYAVYHRERPQIDTYEGYIHLVASRCIVRSQYFASYVWPQVNLDFDCFNFSQLETTVSKN